MRFFILSLGILASASLLAQSTATEVAGCNYASEIQGITITYNEQEFKTLAQHVLYPKYGETSKDFSSEVLASEWLDRVMLSLDTYIDVTDAKYIMGPNGLFSYLVHEINTLPANNAIRKADYIILLCIGERIYADASKPGYKDFEIPRPYTQLHDLAKKEIEEMQDLPGTTIMSTLDFYNKALASESFGTKSFLSSVKQLMIKDLDNSNKAITTLVKETPSFYLKDNVELLISTALQEKYIEKARNYLTQAKKIIFELPGETTALTSKLEAAEKIIRERPTKDLIERIKENYTLYSNCASDQEVVLKMLNNLAYAFQGELKTLPLTQIALGTPENNFEDNIFTAYIDVIGQSFLITTSDRLLDKIRIMILCNNDVVKLADGETIDIVNFFSENTTLSFTRFFFGAPGTDLFPVTDVLFKDANIEGIISEQEMKKGLERLNSIEDVLKK